MSLTMKRREMNQEYYMKIFYEKISKTNSKYVVSPDHRHEPDSSTVVVENHREVHSAV